MPVRSINLKLVVPRSLDKLDIAKALWATHSAINNAVRYYENRLLEMRGEDYLLSEEELVIGSKLRKKLLHSARKAQKGNGKSSLPGRDDVILSELRKLYEYIVPSAVNRRGTAQNANAYISLLTDPNSRGFLSVFDELEDIPPWVEKAQKNFPSAFEEATKWLESPAGQSRLKATGSPPRWVRLARKKDPAWIPAYLDYLERKQEGIQAGPDTIRKLKKLGILPLFPSFLAPKISGSKGVVCPWDRLAFRLAVGHLLSWESWCRIAGAEHGKRLEKLRGFEAQLMGKDLEPAIKALKGYETDRHDRLRTGELSILRPFRITGRMIRGWEDLRNKWQELKPGERTTAVLVEISNREQTRLRGRFGDPDLFRWLAQPENHHVWENRHDAVGIMATYNAMQALVERSRETALMTLPDPVHHPRSAQWEAEGGSNLKNYRFELEDKDGLWVRFPALKTRGDGGYEEIELRLPVAPSGQFKVVKFHQEGKKTFVKYKNGAGETYQGEVGAADLLMNWDYLKHRRLEKVKQGDIGPAYFKISLALNPQLPEGWDGKRPKFIAHFQTAGGQPTKHQDAVEPGLRVLSVDLGIRSFAACSVFELRDQKPLKGLCYAVDGGRLWAVHERSFLLDLSGEQVGPRGQRWREEAREELRQLRRALGRYRSIRNLNGISSDERKASLERIHPLGEDTGLWEFEPALIDILKAGVDLPQAEWDCRIESVLREFRTQFGAIVKTWRRKTRSQKIRDSMGKSMWAIQYLTDVRRFLMSWSLLGRASGEIRRLDRTKRGIFASRLLDHLDAIKEDRLKTGSDLIVQAARGYLRDETGLWHQAYDPCKVILFEDLSRYRMRTDRPRRENSQLMKWTHRAVPKEVSMQAELYGIHCCDTSAAFSSRYHASTGTPGIRCHCLKTSDFRDNFFREIIESENPGIDFGLLKPGELVPLTGGAWLACLTEKGIIKVNADINAAQNLQRRFWTRHCDAFRIRAEKVVEEGREIWIPKSLGKRLLGSLGSYGYLLPDEKREGACQWVSLSPMKYRRLAGLGSSQLNDEVLSADLEELEGLKEEALERSGEVKTFFRDPSGVLLPENRWYPAAFFWRTAKEKTAEQLQAGGCQIF